MKYVRTENGRYIHSHWRKPDESVTWVALSNAGKVFIRDGYGLHNHHNTPPSAAFYPAVAIAEHFLFVLPVTVIQQKLPTCGFQHCQLY